MTVHRAEQNEVPQNPKVSIRRDPRSSVKPTRMPLLLSAIFPGVGQFAQGRKRAGFAYAVPALIAIGFFLFEFLHLMVVRARSFWSEDDLSQNVSASTFRFFVWFGITMAIILLSLWDTYRAFRRQLASHTRKRMDALVTSAESRGRPPPLPPDAFQL